MSIPPHTGRAHRAAHDETSYRAHIGDRKRYRSIDREPLVELTQAGSVQAFERDYADAVAEVLARGGLKPEPKWTVSDCHADDPLGGATLLSEDGGCSPLTNEWPLLP